MSRPHRRRRNPRMARRSLALPSRTAPHKERAAQLRVARLWRGPKPVTRAASWEVAASDCLDDSRPSRHRRLPSLASTSDPTMRRGCPIRPHVSAIHSRHAYPAGCCATSVPGVRNRLTDLEACRPPCRLLSVLQVFLREKCDCGGSIPGLDFGTSFALGWFPEEITPVIQNVAEAAFTCRAVR